MAWVNFQFKFLGAVSSCAEEMEIDMFSTVITAVGTLVGTFVMRWFLDSYFVPWWIRRKVLLLAALCVLMRDAQHAHCWVSGRERDMYPLVCMLACANF